LNNRSKFKNIKTALWLTMEMCELIRWEPLNVLSDKMTVNNLLGWLVLIELWESIVLPNFSIGGISYISPRL
jgi:hypothetical protein